MGEHGSRIYADDEAYGAWRILQKAQAEAAEASLAKTKAEIVVTRAEAAHLQACRRQAEEERAKALGDRGWSLKEMTRNVCRANKDFGRLSQKSQELVEEDVRDSVAALAARSLKQLVITVMEARFGEGERDEHSNQT